MVLGNVASHAHEDDEQNQVDCTCNFVPLMIAKQIVHVGGWRCLTDLAWRQEYGQKLQIGINLLLWQGPAGQHQIVNRHSNRD